MSFFSPRSSASFYEPNYSGLFRLIDEFNNYAAEATGISTSAEAAAAGNSNSNNAAVAAQNNTGGNNKRRSLLRDHRPLAVWTPKFDLHETPNTYVLHGEFPGVEKKDISIEFTDEQTLTIRGRSESSHTHSEGLDDDDVVMVHGSNGDKDSKDNKDNKDNKDDKDNKDNKDNKDKDKEAPQSKDKEPEGGKGVAHQDKGKQQVGVSAQPKLRYWVSERSLGEFARSFTFPTRVDSSGVVAKLDNGVLNLVVPKAAKPQGRKVNIL